MSEIINLECNNDFTKGLKYKGLSIVFMQIFTLEFDNKKLKKRKEDCKGDFSVCCIPDNLKKYVERDLDPIDKQIFIYSGNKSPVERYKLKEFTFNIDLEEPYPLNIKGKMHVEMSLFFNKTVSITYRMVIDDEIVKASDLLTTDHVISLISLAEGAEHWSMSDDGSHTDINVEIDGLSIESLFLDCNGKWDDNYEENCRFTSDKALLTQVFNRYKECVLHLCDDVRCNNNNGKLNRKKKKDENKIPTVGADTIYAFVDIWESLQHYDNLFGRIKEEEIISHIMEHHKRELVGLMSLYPAEWPYRTEEAHDDVCGENVAIDTDDLILVNQNVCVVFGTYGLRGGKEAPTDWEEHLKERSHYHVSWPEYLLILEMVLAKKHTISYVTDILLESVLSDKAFENPNKAIEANAKLSIEITKLLSKLDAVKYSKFVSHKIMFDRTRKRLGVEEDREKLEEMMERIDNSLNNISETQSLKQGTLLNIVLGGISVASLFQIIFMETKIPFLESLKIQSNGIGISLIGITIFLIFTGLMTLLIYTVNVRRKK
ncbi:MAG: hypothetical protein LBP67_10265 [Bacteroidales bacterium]|jgi:hypothetical protein|nr:hypothetical protein [Bacteroidales bacterium]